MERMKGAKRMALRSRVRAFVMVAFLASSLLVSAAQGNESAAIKPGPKDKCPVCGMLVAPFPNWWAAVVFKGGSHVFFDGPKDMFKYLLDIKRYDPSKKNKGIESVQVTDYYKVSPIDGSKAWYVAGSDVNGPMGEELVPFKQESDAKAFSKDHKGKKIFTFNAVTLETLRGPEGNGLH